ncbi:type II toxin-antitoxin system HicB family antitoxin [Synechocystis sp. LEGE 06083]|uniref:type II toxin-antitoxin system HicB family antitoxin n=1 Tax=Synechocystis sp. LEGE 06083 TaxID=915336 RepID=UPI00187EF72C|nr:type II toxin-antitoxin system HicB family antitoxin [Synechocystis sp. LEGE 06083]MBE9197095.1 type II toxin-antitoxin system HicB family antitoxin [Synechocystis sp. LEGE 06083]
MALPNIFNDYTINLFQDKDRDWLAYLVEMPSVSAFSDSPQAALAELEIAWQEVRESYRKHGDPIPIIEKVYAKS